MDNSHSEDHQKQKFQKYKSMRRTLEFVISVCVFSFFVWYSSGFSILHDQFLNVYFSTFLFSFITRTLERKYMFLICNGILAFLAKTFSTTSSSPSPSSSSSSSLSSISSPTFNLQLQDHASRFEEEEVEQAKLREDREGEELLESPEEEEEEERDDHDGALCDQMVEEEEGGGENEAFEITDEEEEGGIGSDMMMVRSQEDEATTTATNEELVNTEEMNRKFEEFIRKMKEEMRIEAQRQLIAV